MESMRALAIAFVLLATTLSLTAAIPSDISAVFAFGDSTLDSGNNDGKLTVVRADHAPYGVDFPSQEATVRFSNGRIITDFLVNDLGFKDSLSPSSTRSQLSSVDLVTGVSFASGGSGLDDLTAQMSGVATMADQLEDFKAYVGDVQRLVGNESAKVVGGAMYLIGAGSNDMMMNYYALPTRSLTYSVSSYHGFLLERLESLVQELYKMGGRMFTISGLPPIGCIPMQMTSASFMQFGQRSCVDQQNQDSAAYNNMLQATIERMRDSLLGSKFGYVDIYNQLMDMIKNPNKYGFTETTRGCCGTGLMEMGPTCNSLVPTCSDPSKFLFWDAVHPSEAAYHALAKQLLQLKLE